MFNVLDVQKSIKGMADIAALSTELAQKTAADLSSTISAIIVYQVDPTSGSQAAMNILNHTSLT